MFETIRASESNGSERGWIVFKKTNEITDFQLEFQSSKHFAIVWRLEIDNYSPWSMKMYRNRFNASISNAHSALRFQFINSFDSILRLFFTHQRIKMVFAGPKTRFKIEMTSSRNLEFVHPLHNVHRMYLTVLFVKPP